jgi:hypothetical protein
MITSNESYLRIRDNGTVRELNIPKDILEVLERIVSKNIMDQLPIALIVPIGSYRCTNVLLDL